MSKKPLFISPLNSQHVKGSQTLLKSAPQQFYNILSSLSAQLIWKTSLLVISQILGLFVNTLTPNEEYFLNNRENLPVPIQLQTSKKQKKFLQFFPVQLFKKQKNLPENLAVIL